VAFDGVVEIRVGDDEPAEVIYVEIVGEAGTVAVEGELRAID
jgi:hypothetical protein